MPPRPATSFPGPAVLGRGVVVGPDTPSPPGFATVRRVVVDDDVLAAPRPVADLLHHHWRRREPVVIELRVEQEALREPEIVDAPLWSLPDDLELDRDRLHFLVWANTYDARGDAPIWWHGVLAERAGAAPSDTADVQVAGTDTWVDGGPRGPLPLPSVHRESVGLGRLTIQHDPEPSDDLAPDQRAAVGHGAGPARIVAPAGSGKTRVLTARLRHLLAGRGIEPELVTAVAYNTRAAAEMRARTADLRADVRTIHSLALWICNRVERREVIGERDVRTILDRLVRTGKVPNQDPFQPYLEALTEVRLALREPAEVEARRGDVDGLTQLVPAYRTELARRGVLDFDEQVHRACELLLTNPALRREVQRRCTHLLVDEFQDLTPAFLLLLRLAAGPSTQLFAVGDDDQTIYSYAGATPDFLIDLDRWFPDAADHPLEVNYRCPPAVVTGAVTLLGHNRHRVPKTIRAADRAAGTTTDGDLAVHRIATGAMAARTIALVEGWIAEGTPPDEIAVLARVNSALLPVQVAMAEAGVPHRPALDATVLRRTGIATALAYLRLGLDPERLRREDILATLNRPARKVRGRVEPFLRRRPRWTATGLADVVTALDGNAADRFAGYLDDLAHLTDAITDGADTARCLWVIRNRVGLGEAMDALDSSRTLPQGSSHGDDLDALAQLALLQPDPVAFQSWLEERLAAADPAVDSTGVVLSTVHRVKGMEWDRVVVYAANRGLVPHRLATDPAGIGGGIEEERRILHVAVTRSRRTTAVVADKDQPSPFLDQLTTPAPARPERPAAVVRGAALVAGGQPVAPDDELTLPGGLRGRVVATSDGIARARPRTTPGATVTVDGVSVRVPVGTPVTTADGTGGRLAPAPRPTVAAPGAGRLPGVATGDDGLDADDEALFEALRRWRGRLASERGHPAYVILQDRALKAIASRRPANLRELAAVPGIGPTKLDQFGDDLLTLVADADG